MCDAILGLLQSRMPVRPFEILYDAVDLYKSDLVIESAEDGFRVSDCVWFACMLCIDDM